MRRSASHTLICTLVALVVTACASAPRNAPTATASADVLFWTRDQKIAGFPHYSSLFANHVVARGRHVHPLPTGAPLSAFAAGGPRAAMLDSFMVSQETAGLLVVQDGRIRLERYALGYSASGTWTSFSVAKSITSTLVGAAVRDGYIRSVDDSVTRYIPELRGSAYDGVTVRHLLTMTSGVAFNEDYADSNSDIARLYRLKPPPGVDMNVAYMRTMPREAPPGTKWQYKTPETNLTGLLVIRATRRPLATYLSEKIWRPYGMEQDATWLVDAVGDEQGGCCLQASLHDYARFGEFILDGGRIDGRPVLPDGWLAAATTKRVDIGRPGAGYGYQWWTTDDGTYDARGIFGQSIHIDPARRLVVVISSAWPVATGTAQTEARANLLAAISRAVDAERGGR